MRFLLCACALLLPSLFITAQPHFTDSSFGTNGKVIENASRQRIKLVDALLQPDGKSLILSTTEDYYNDHPILIRYNSDGTPDTNFNGNGIIDSLFQPGFNCNPYAIRLQPDGKILVCGSMDSSTTRYAFVMRYNANGSPDTSFGTKGALYISSLTVNGTSAPLYAVEDMAVLPGGKLTLLSNLYYFSSSDIALIRLNPDGSYDNSFGTNGVAAVSPLGSAAGTQRYRHMEVLTNGKYIISGSPGTNPSSGVAQPYIVVRLNASGTLDNTYGSGGSVRLTGGAANDQVEDMVVQPDGKVIISGSEYAYASHTYNTLIRLTASGAPDAGFGNSGKTVLHFSATGFSSHQAHLGLQADGKILIGGVARNSDGNYTIAAARLTTAGTLDASFDGDGVALMQVNGYNSYGYVPLPQSDGRITVAGYAYKNSFTSITIGRFTANGQTDGSLSAATAVLVPNNKIDYNVGTGVLIQPADQKIVSVQDRTNGFDYDVYISRHLSNGRPDSSFGQNGRAFINIPGETDFSTYSGISSDGKITIVPHYFDYVSGGKLAVYRLKANGQPDSSFGLNGKKLFRSRNTDTIFNLMRYALVQPDGKTLIIAEQLDGTFGTVNVPDSIFLIRLNVDGSFDNTFGIAGRKLLSIGGSREAILAIQPDEKIIVATSITTSTSNYQPVIRRLNANGTLDNAFNNGQDKLLNLSATQILVQANGRILIGSNRKKVFRLLPNGNYDTTFGVTGVFDATRYNPEGETDFYFRIAADSSRIVLMTTLSDSLPPYDDYSKIIALSNNGSPDSTFGQAGVAIPDFSPPGYAYHMALQADKKIVITGGGISTENPYLYGFILTRLKSTNAPTRLYTFTGNGLWSNPANWADGAMPPTTIPAGSSIVIDPPAGSECVIDISVEVKAGATVVIKAGKKVRLPGDLILQ